MASPSADTPGGGGCSPRQATPPTTPHATESKEGGEAVGETESAPVKSPKTEGTSEGGWGRTATGYVFEDAETAPGRLRSRGGALGALVQGVTDEDVAAVYDMFVQDPGDGDGGIGAAQLCSAMEELGSAMSLEEARAIIDVIDVDGNGVLDYGEFKQMLTSRAIQQDARVEMLRSKLLHWTSRKHTTTPPLQQLADVRSEWCTEIFKAACLFLTGAAVIAVLVCMMVFYADDFSMGDNDVPGLPPGHHPVDWALSPNGWVIGVALGAMGGLSALLGFALRSDAWVQWARGALEPAMVQMHRLDMGKEFEFKANLRVKADEGAHIQEVFRRFDDNGDGVLSHAEMRKAMRKLGFVDDADAESTMQEYDADHDGVFTFAEFNALMRSKRAHAAQDLAQKLDEVKIAAEVEGWTPAELRERRISLQNAYACPRTGATHARVNIGSVNAQLWMHWVAVKQTFIGEHLPTAVRVVIALMLLGIIGFGVIGWILMLRIAHMPDPDDDRVWNELAWQVVNGIFSLVAVWRCPQRLWMLSRLLRHQNCVVIEGEERSQIFPGYLILRSQLLTVAWLRNFNVLCQIFTNVFFWGWLERCVQETMYLHEDCTARPRWPVSLLMLLSSGSDVAQALYLARCAGCCPFVAFAVAADDDSGMARRLSMRPDVRPTALPEGFPGSQALSGMSDALTGIIHPTANALAEASRRAPVPSRQPDGSRHVDLDDPWLQRKDSAEPFQLHRKNSAEPFLDEGLTEKGDVRATMP